MRAGRRRTRTAGVLVASALAMGALGACRMERGKTVREAPAEIALAPAVERAGVHEGGVLALAALTDGRVLSSGADGIVRVWDDAGTEIGRIETASPSASAGLAAAGDGRVALLPTAAGVLVWDADARTESTRLAGAVEPSRIALAPDARAAAAAAADGALTVWPLPAGAPPLRLRPHAGRVVGLALVTGSAGPTLLSAGDDDRLCETSLADGRARCVEAPGEGTSVVAFSPDGGRAASGNRVGEVRLWETATGRALGTFAVHDGEVTALAFTPDGTRLVTGGADRMATLLDAATGRVRRRLLAPGGYVSAVAVAMDGRTALVGTDDGSILRWQLVR